MEGSLWGYIIIGSAIGAYLGFIVWANVRAARWRAKLTDEARRREDEEARAWMQAW